MNHSINYYDEYTEKAQAWARGYAQALRDYGIWRDGQQVIGCLDKPIKEIIKELEESVSIKPGEL